MLQEQEAGNRRAGEQGIAAPPISLPKGGGAIRGIGEKFAANPVTGTGSMTVPLATSPSRSGFGPQLALSYDSGAGNGPFGFGWSLSIPAITRKTDKGLPLYFDGKESDVYILSGAEDLVPVLGPNGVRFEDATAAPGFTIHRYRPRIEGLFARIERWTDLTTGEIHWRSISRDNVTTLYGKTAGSRIADPAHPTHIFTWLICESYDDKGNAIVYQYAAENDAAVDRSRANERNRVRSANRYLKRIAYGNLTPNRDADWNATDPVQIQDWRFEVVFDYDEGHYEPLEPEPGLTPAEQHQRVLASAATAKPWALRPDPFSSHRAGFEVRTYRRCHRVLMFHRFDELGDERYLVRSTEIDYADLDDMQRVTIESELAHQGSTRFASFIRRVTQSGYVRDDAQAVLDGDGVKYVTYLEKPLPSLEFEYSKAAIQDDIRELDADSLENLPIGLDGAAYQWVDLDGEGVSGVLTQQAGAWFYKANLGEGRFGPLQTVAAKPSLATLDDGRHQFLDLAGDGQLDVVTLDRATPGFYERTQDGDWQPFRPFRHRPNIAWDDPNLRLVDLDGDGHADILITQDDVFTWHPSMAEDGYGPARPVHQPVDEEHGPRLVFADGAQSIYLADMCGDGLTDLVRIRNGEVCYWPNLGYGRFGAKVAMDDAPQFDHPDQFDQERVRLADIDGSGATDIIYLGRDGVRLYFNQSGNRWSEPRHLTPFPRVDRLSAVTTADLLGNGTACLVWSSPLPADTGRPMRYIDLMGGQKPHLLVKTANNLGAETHVHYAASTKFYLSDRAAGNPWITRLPFPVHVVERVEAYDRISRNRFVTRYAYHHGYFDGSEREFRGFGMVEQFDTEELAALTAAGRLANGTNIDAASHVPPVHTKSWFHTGIHFDRVHVSDYFAGLLDEQDQGEYYREPGLTDAQARQLLLEDTELPAGLTVEEEREACRALKGAMLRQEVYALDGTDSAEHPYTVTEQNFTIRMLQPRGDNRHAVFFTHAREALRYHYERNPEDPRISHALTLEVDEYGNALKTVAIGYGRRQPDFTLPVEDRVRQMQTLISYAENRVTNAIDAADDYRTPLPCEARTFELTGLTLPTGQRRFTLAEMLTAGTGAVPLAYEQNPTAGVRQKRLIEHVRTLYRRDDLAGALLPGELQTLALPFESYKLAFTPGLLAQVYGGRVSNTMLETEGRYVHSEGDANGWIPSGQVFFSPGSADTSTAELAHAREHFFLPHRFRDPFHTTAFSTETVVRYDAYDLLIVETRDALDNVVTVETQDDTGGAAVRIDYRVLQPYGLTDPNGNRTRATFDALGMVVATAVMGKPPPAPVQGDTLDGFEADLTEADTLAHLANPLANPHVILRGATTRLVYDLFAYHRTKNQPNPQPAVVYTLAREKHLADLAPGEATRIQHSFAYSDGFGREIQKKIQAEPGPAPMRDELGKIIVGPDGQPEMTSSDVNPRWMGSGWTVFNNKGKPVRQYEPFFTDTHRFEFDVRIGVSPVLFYDPVERVVATLHANHTWEKVVFDPWRQETWDVSDTVLVSDPTTDPDVGDYFKSMPDADYLPTWHAQRQGGALGPHEQAAARKSAVHAETPTVAHADSLGRAFLTVAHNRFKYSDAPPADPPVEEFYRTRVMLDIEGNQREVIDARDRVVMRYDYDMLGNRVHQASMEAGERWMLNDVAGNPIYAWDSRDHQFRTNYDQLRRPADSYLREGAAPELRIGRAVYGEAQQNPEANNLRGKTIQLFDQAGVVTSDDYDFKGNLLSSRRQLAQEFKSTLNWPGVSLESETYTSRTRYDALNRPIQLIPPHSDRPGAKVNVIQPTHNEANLLEQLNVWLNQDAEPAAMLAPQTANQRAVTDIDYDAKGQRTRIDYGNGVTTTYEYDSLTFRLTRLTTTRPAGLNGLATQLFKNAGTVQDLNYTYDPAGNITRIADDALPTLFFANQQVDPVCQYTYDALYRLIEAQGRESSGQSALQVGVPQASHRDYPFAGLGAQPSDPKAVRNYRERYDYDEVGNLLHMIHQAHNGSWQRDYRYEEHSLLEPAKVSNRLSGTDLHPNGSQPHSESYTHDAHGNMTTMPHLALMQWDFTDQLQATARQVVNNGTPETTYYVYDVAGQRVRKITERQNGTRRNERIYLGGFEVYREYAGNGTDVNLERETLHVMDDQQRIALVETRTQGDDGSPQQLIRYQLSNHLGSASLELDDAGQVISYEEYYSYGSTSYQAGRSAAEVSLKRFRYTAMERDEETGLNYHGARYYTSWLGRWTATDPAGIEAGFNLYAFVLNNPVKLTDQDGADPKQPAGSNTTFMPPNQSNIGTYIHSIVLRTIQLRLARWQIPSLFEVETTSGGSKRIWSDSSGYVDLAILTPDGKQPNSVIAHLYELKPRNPSKYQDYVSEVDHYTEYFPSSVYGLQVSQAKIGGILEYAAKIAPSLLDPIEIKSSVGTVSVRLDLARDNSGDAISGLIVYDVYAQRNRSEAKEFEREFVRSRATSVELAEAELRVKQRAEKLAELEREANKYSYASDAVLSTSARNERRDARRRLEEFKESGHDPGPSRFQNINGGHALVNLYLAPAAALAGAGYGLGLAVAGAGRLLPVAAPRLIPAFAP